MRAQLYSIQGLPAGRISIMARPRGGDWLLDEIKALREASVDVLVSLLTPAEVMEFDLREEAECCRRQGLGRAALMAASVLVLTGFSPGQAFALLSRARGYPVPETEEQRAWVVAVSRDQRSLPDY